jgi:hypothetical protein
MWMADDSSTLHKTLMGMLLVSLRSLGQREQVTILNQAGFGQKEIAEMLGSTPKATMIATLPIQMHSKMHENDDMQRAWRSV